MKTDVLIVGSGCAGLYAALWLPKDLNILIITKSKVDKSDSFLAQGGMCVLRDGKDYDSYYEDTMKAGHYENNPEAVSIMINNSKDVLNDLLSYGTNFKKEENGELAYTKEGAHSNKRIVFHKDITGKEITSKLLAQVQKRNNIQIMENCTMLDMICKQNTCHGVVVENSEGFTDTILARCTIFATGGIGGLYEHSTNYKHLTGDGVAIAMKHGVIVENLNYVQIHPTTLYNPDNKERSFLISESVRGEGAVLYNAKGERFVNELMPRDMLTAAILEQMKKDKSNHVWLSMEKIPNKEIAEHFPNIVKHCKDAGYDVYTQWIPVVPAQHYFMGGIKIDMEGRTSMNQLYAIGETACNGVHGKNRLASNSLLESLVFAKRAAFNIAQNIEKNICNPNATESVDFNKYEDREKLALKYKNLVLKEIARLNNNV